MKKINFVFNQMVLFEMIYYVLFLILGVIIFFNSDMTNKMAAILISVFLILKGVLEILASFNQKKYFLFQFSIVLGILSIILAILMIINPFKLLNYIGLFLGIWFVAEGLNKYMIYLKFKRAKEGCAHIFILSTLITVFMGILIIINPFVNFAITQISGAFIALYSVLTVSDLVLIKNHSKAVLKLYK